MYRRFDDGRRHVLAVLRQIDQVALEYQFFLRQVRDQHFPRVRASSNVDDLHGRFTTVKTCFLSLHEFEDGLSFILSLVVAVDREVTPSHRLKVLLISRRGHHCYSLGYVAAQATGMIVVMMHDHNILDGLTRKRFPDFFLVGFGPRPPA